MSPERLRQHAITLDFFATLAGDQMITDLRAAVRTGAEALRDAAVAKEGGSGASAEYPNKAATLPNDEATSVRATSEPPSGLDYPSVIDRLYALVTATACAVGEGGLERDEANTPYGKFIAEHGLTIIAALQLGLQAEAKATAIEAEMATNHKFHVLRERDQWKRRAEAAEAALLAIRKENTAEFNDEMAKCDELIQIFRARLRESQS